MQFSSVFTILAVAMTASAIPSGGKGGGGSTEINACSSKTANVCCGSTVLGCLITLIGKECAGESYCCDTNAPEVSPFPQPRFPHPHQPPRPKLTLPSLPRAVPSTSTPSTASRSCNPPPTTPTTTRGFLSRSSGWCREQAHVQHPHTISMAACARECKGEGGMGSPDWDTEGIIWGWM